MVPFNKHEYPLCKVSRGGYNYVVLDDPTGPGLLVYLLRPKGSANSVPIGGHYRISVSADGKNITQVDRLSASCLEMDKTGGNLPKGSTVERLVASHIVSATPVETHVFVALQDKVRMTIVTPNKGGIWDVSDGKVTPMNEKPAEEEKLQPPPASK
jgi:hypothetical protein